jgi:adenylate kinase
LALYEEQTRPLLEHYAAEGKLTTVDGVGTEDEVFKRLVAAIDDALP